MQAKTKKIALTQRKMNGMYRACEDLMNRNDPLSQEFAYALAFNMDAIENHVKAFDRAARSDKAYLKYEEERVELAKAHSNKDDRGQAILKPTGYDINDQFAFDKELQGLRHQHPAYQKRQEALDEEVDVELWTVNKIHVPPYIGLAYMSLFFCFIDQSPIDLVCPACNADLYMDGNQLRQVEKPGSEEETEPEPVKKKTKRRGRQPGR